jgi:hypothetical protein
MSSFARKQKSTNILNPNSISVFVLLIGIAEIAFSIIFNSSILAFIGLGFVFFGLILNYIRTEGYVKRAILDATLPSQTSTLNEIIQKLGYQGQVVYLPPKYFENPNAKKAYLPKTRRDHFPTPEQLKISVSTLNIDEGIFFTPPGADLADLIEKTLEKNVLGADMQYLKRALPPVFVDLGLASHVSLIEEEGSIIVLLQNCIFSSNPKQSATYCFTDNSILASALACLLTKTTGKPLEQGIEEVSADGKMLTIKYHLIGEFGFAK